MITNEDYMYALFIGISNAPITYEKYIKSIEKYPVSYTENIKDQYEIQWEDRSLHD